MKYQPRAWITRITREARSASVKFLGDTTNVRVEAGAVGVELSVMNDRHYDGAFGRNAVRVIPDQPSYSILAAQFHDAGVSNDDAVAERIFRDACYVYRTGVRAGKNSRVSRDVSRLLSAAKLPMWLAMTMTAEGADARWLLAGEDGVDAYTGVRYVLASFYYDGPLAQLDGMRVGTVGGGALGLLLTVRA